MGGIKRQGVWAGSSNTDLMSDPEENGAGRRNTIFKKIKTRNFHS